MSARNNEADILRESHRSNQDDLFTKNPDYWKSIVELKQRYQRMHDKLELHGQTMEMNFQLLHKELKESKAESEKRNRLFVSLFQQLRPEFKTLSSVEEMLSEVSIQDEGKRVEEPRSGMTLQLQQKQQQQQQRKMQHFQRTFHQQQFQQLQQQQHQQQDCQRKELEHRTHQNLVGKQNDGNNEILKALFDERDERVGKNMKEMEELLKFLKEEVEELKDHTIFYPLRTDCSGTDDEEDTRRVYRNASYVPDEIIERIKEEELEHRFLPSDTYSYFAVADYVTVGRYFVAPSPALSIATFVLVIQVITLSIFIMDVVDFKNKTNPLSVPPGVSSEVRVSQLIALLISCWNQDEIRASFNVLSLGYHKGKVRAINRYATRRKWRFSIFIRMVLGWLSLVVTCILIVNSKTVRDVMLDFAAVTFVSELDNGAFQLSLWGYLGKDLQQFALKIKNVPVYEQISSADESSKKKRKVPRLVWLLIVFSLVIGFWTWVTIKQERGDYLPQSLFVQFGDDFSPALGAFSGIYKMELDDTIDGMRVNYVELGKSDGRFSYCAQDKRWIFQYDDEPNGYHNHWFSECWHKARSSKTETYDLTQTSSITWFVLDEDLSLMENPLQHFLVEERKDYDGKPCKSDDDCGGQMHCNHREKKCVCNDGLFGFNCEFRQPCQTLEIDSRDPNGFVGTRSWSKRYSSLSHNAGEGEGINDGSPIQVYGKPIFVGDESLEGIIDVMLFTGRRWILTDSISITDYTRSNETSPTLSLSDHAKNDDNSIKGKRNLAIFLANNFHAYWSNYTFHFASEAVDVGTPTDSATPEGLEWFRPETIGTEGASFRSGEQIWQGKTSIQAKLLCAVCHNETNPCFYGATCRTDGTCDCTTGSSGRICQIPPDNNGNCDVFFNTPEFRFDGGDCCEESCVSTDDYVCGRAYINAGGVSAYGFVGYPNCKDSRFSSKLSGSKTLFQIIERGTVRCGLGISDGWLTENEDGSYSGFELDLCKAIAAAAVGDPEGIEIVETTWLTRWEDFAADKFDVLLIPTTHTAQRDIYQMGVGLGLTFASHVYLFDGLRFGGIPPFTKCADNINFDSPECQELKICTVVSTTWHRVVQEHFPAAMIVEVNSVQATYEALEAGHCNVITGELTNLAELVVRNRGFTGSDYEIGSNVFSKEPMAAITQQNDGVWSKFVSWTFHALIQAEESGITQSTAYKLAPTKVFGEHFEYMFRNAVAANGNFGEIFQKHFKKIIPRDGLNAINDGKTGLIYGFPLGSYEVEGPGPIAGGTIATIRKRGFLNCGVKTITGFAEVDETNTWKGFDVDICRGIAAALLGGAPNVNFVALTSAERFEVLSAGTIDVLVGSTTRTLEREVKEASTGLGFDFTPPIFYDGLSFGGSPLYAKCADVLDFGSRKLECSNTLICVHKGSTWLDQMRGRLAIPERNIMATQHADESYQKLTSGLCNVLAGETAYIARTTVEKHGWPVDEDYYVGVRKYTKEPLAIVSRTDDAQFSDFLRWIVNAFFVAEGNTPPITREEYFYMPSNFNLFGGTLSAMWQHAIAVVGNYGEIFERNFEGILQRGGQNSLNNNNGPQFFALPGVVVNM